MIGLTAGNIAALLLFGESPVSSPSPFGDEASTQAITGFLYGYFKLPSLKTAGPCLAKTEYGQQLGIAYEAIKN